MLDIFLHIPKTAGSSLRKTFQSIYQKERILTLDSPTLDKFKNHNYDEKNIDLLMGHMPFGIHNYFSSNVDFRYFTIIRNPLSRAISHYFMPKNIQIII